MFALAFMSVCKPSLYGKLKKLKKKAKNAIALSL